MATEDEFLLKWHDHHQSFFLLVEELVMREQLTDVTLACGDATNHQLLSAHSLMLSVCSPYFRTLLSENRHKEKHHIIHLHGVAPRHMQQLLLYMYRGEISISQEDLVPLIETARCLQIKGLSMATPTPPLSSPKKRPHSVMGGEGYSSPPAALQRRRGGRQKLSPSTSSLSPEAGEHLQQQREEQERDQEMEVMEKQLVVNVEDDPEPGSVEELGQDFISCQGKAHTSPIPLPGSMALPPFSNVSLPVLPKPLSILKTAETRTYLSKLIWLGNGGKRPQYGNPETKPCWWPQHILPWEEMKKMGGRKSVELSHINYTEILKQCLAAGYEYFGYDPLTYHSNGFDDSAAFHNSHMDDGEEGEEEEDDDEKQREPVLEIDLDEVENCKSGVRSSEQSRDILCK